MADKNPVEADTESEEMKGKIVYELAADATCLFDDGQSIRICKAMISIHSKYFMEAFFGTKKCSKIKIKGFDKESFKTFVDCLFGLKEYTLSDALLIYPIAHRYDVKDSLQKCAAVLKPKQLDENVPRVLNLSTLYKCSELTDHVVQFIKFKCGVVNFLENEMYRKLLEPLAVVELIKNVDPSFLVWMSVYRWGESYVKNREELNIENLFKENGISEKISASHFESAQALIIFGAITHDQLLSSNQILPYLGINMCRTKALPIKSGWSKINKGYSLTERLAFKPFWASGGSTIAFAISANKILIEPKNLISDVVKIDVRLFRRKASWTSASESSNAWEGKKFRFFYSDDKVDEQNFHFSPFFPDKLPSFDIYLDEDSINNFCGKFEAKLESTSSHEIHSVEVTYTFNFQCRILKTSLNPGQISGDDPHALFFTKNISMSELKATEK